MSKLLSGALEVQQFFKSNGWRFCFIGGIAVQRWGEPRFTQDLDLTLITGFGNEQKFMDILLARFASRLSDPVEFALKNRVLLLSLESKVPIDVSLGALPYEERLVGRSSEFSLTEKIVINTCSAEDLIILKVFAGRDRDWADVRAVLTRQGRRLDYSLIFGELPELLEIKGEIEALDRLKKIQEELINSGKP